MMAAGGAAADGGGQGGDAPASLVKALLQGLQPGNLEDAAGVLSGLELSDRKQAQAVAFQLYSSALSGSDQADTVSSLMAALVALDRGGGNARLLRRLVLERCEGAFNVTPPPGMAWPRGALADKLGAVRFVGALLRARVIPASIIHSCLDELLQQGGKHAATTHDLHCASILLNATAQQLDGLSPESMRAVDGYFKMVQAALDKGKLKGEQELASSLQRLCKLRAAGWVQPDEQRQQQGQDPGQEQQQGKERGQAKEQRGAESGPACMSAETAGSAQVAEAAEPAFAEVQAMAEALGQQLSLGAAEGPTAPAAAPAPTPANSPATFDAGTPLPVAPQLISQLPQPQCSAAAAAGPPLVLAPQQRPPYMPLPRQAQAQEYVQAQPLRLPAPALHDAFHYLSPDGSGQLFGPFSLEQLLFWTQQGHMAVNVKVKQHNTVGALWLELATVQQCISSGMALPTALPAQQPTPVYPTPAAMHPFPAAAPAVEQPNPTAASVWGPPAPAPAPASTPATARGMPFWSAPAAVPAASSSTWQGHVGPSPHPGLNQQQAPMPEAWPVLSGSTPAPALRPQAVLPPTFGHQQQQPQPQPAPAQVPAAPAQPGPARAPSLPDAASWEAPKAAARPVPTAASAPLPVPVGVRKQAAAGVQHQQQPPQQPQGRSFRANSGAASNGGNGSSGGRGKKKSSVGYEDDKEWLVKNARGKVTGPFTGHELLAMLHDDTLPEDSLIKKNDWKSYRPLEEVEGAILEMFSKKPASAGKPGAAGASHSMLPPKQQQQLARRSSDLENARSAGGGSGGGGGNQGMGWAGATAGRVGNGSWQQRSVIATLTQNAAGGSGSPRQAAGRAQQGAGRAAATLAASFEGSAGGACSPAAAGTSGGTSGRAARPPAGSWATPLQLQRRAGAQAGTSPGATPTIAADPPAGATPAPAASPGSYSTPGCPAAEAGLLGGFSPSPGAPQAAPAAGAGHRGSALSPTHSPAGFAQLAAGLGGAGGPQVASGPKLAFAAWSAAEARAKAGGSSGNNTSSGSSATQQPKPAQARALKQPCGTCQLEESAFLWIPCGHWGACAACAPATAPPACPACGGKASQRVRVYDT